MGQFATFLTWYRIKSDSKHVFLKISGAKYLDEQPTSLEDAEAFALETIEGTENLRQIYKEDGRTLVVKLDLRGTSLSQLNLMPCVKYAIIATSQGMDIDYFEVTGAGSWWPYVMSLASQYLRDRMILKE